MDRPPHLKDGFRGVLFGEPPSAVQQGQHWTQWGWEREISPDEPHLEEEELDDDAYFDEKQLDKEDTSQSSQELNFLPFNRFDVTEHCRKVFGKLPKPEQLEVVEHIAERRSCFLIAGCGWGKSLCYFLPMALWNKHVVVVISPLKVLMSEQEKKLNDAGILTTTLNSDKKVEPAVLKLIADGAYRAVFMTPEIIFEDSGVADLWKNDQWIGQLAAVVLDEVHCISTWGMSFRPRYRELWKLRPRTLGVPFVGLSATLTNTMLEEIKQHLCLKSAVVIRPSDTRTNVHLEVRFLPGHNHTGALNFVVAEDNNKSLQKTLIYVDSRKEALVICKHLWSVAPSYRDKIAGYHAMMSLAYKRKTMQKFIDNEIVVLVATEAAGMGCDIPDVIRVIQYKNPASLTSLVQRIGRAARDPAIQGTGILITGPITTPDKYETGLYNFIKAKKGTCRWKIIDEVFGNGAFVDRTGKDCCDNCRDGDRQRTSVPLQGHADPGAGKKVRAKPCREEDMVEAEETILAWRKEAFENSVNSQLFGATDDALLSDRQVKKLRSNLFAVNTKEDVERIAGWRPLKAHSTELAERLIRLKKHINNRQKARQEILKAGTRSSE